MPSAERDESSDEEKASLTATAISKLVATGGREDYFEPCGNLGRPTVTICTRILARKIFFRGWAENAPGRVLDRFWDHQKFLNFSEKRPRKNLPTDPRRPPGGSSDIFPKTQKVTQKVTKKSYIRDPQRTLET